MWLWWAPAPVSSPCELAEVDPAGGAIAPRARWSALPPRSGTVRAQVMPVRDETAVASGFASVTVTAA